MKHPLEGEHIVYNYGTQDYAGEGFGLSLYRLENSTMIEVYNPVNHVIEPHCIGKSTNDELLGMMKKRQIRKVYSVYHTKDFFGIPARWISLDEYKKDEVELWAEWKMVERDSAEYYLLQENGVEVIFYEED